MTVAACGMTGLFEVDSRNNFFYCHLNYVHNIVAKPCTTERQSCQEPETFPLGDFFKKKLIDLCKIN